MNSRKRKKLLKKLYGQHFIKNMSEKYLKARISVFSNESLDAADNPFGDSENITATERPTTIRITKENL